MQKGTIIRNSFQRTVCKLKNSFVKGLCLLSVLVLFPLSAIAQVECNFAGQTTPGGLNNFFVINADGVFDPATSNYQLPPGSDFDVNILGRNTAASLARRNDAYMFFLSEYGIDFFGGTTNPDGTVLSVDGNVLLFHTAIDPRWDQQVIYSGGDMVPPDGWVVHEARYAATVIGPVATFTGVWGGAGGELVPNGATVTDGEWVFEKEVPCRNTADNSSAGTQSSRIHLRYQTDVPFIPDFRGRAAVDYNITPISGVSATTGTAIGRVELNILTGDLIQAIVKATVRLR